MCSQEVLSGAGLMLVPDEEYSEAGRGVYPDGLFQVLVAFYDRYRVRKPKLRYIITENGFADARDLIRRPYLLEHLLAVHAAIKEVGHDINYALIVHF
jgi:beta-glucosidase/6-phospho-beta-glucosidase/beta-galactosidase